MRRLAAALALAALAMATPAAAQSRPLIAAHRGGAALWPENSVLAFRNALALGVDVLETDVHLSADGEPIVMHDPTLDRTTTGTGAVRDRRLAELETLRLRAGDGTPTDEPVPTLARVLDVLRPTRARLLLEIKVGADRRPYPGIEARVLALVRDRGLLDRTLVMAFHAETLTRARGFEPALTTVLLVNRARMAHDGAPAVVRAALDCGAAYLGVDHRALDAPRVALIRGAGLRLAAWTVDAADDLRRVVELGVDVLITDRPDAARRAVGRLQPSHDVKGVKDP